MSEEKSKKSKPDNIIIPRKALWGIAPVIAVAAVLISKGDMGPLLLFAIGIFAGVLIGKGYFQK